MSTLFVIGTPIGNLEDITLRALRVLKEVDVILCEDTRITKRLLSRFEINGKQLTTYNEERSGVGIGKIIKWLEEGKNLALVTDAGTPGISDPGARLVSLLREIFKVGPSGSSRSDLGGRELKIEAIPGPSALTAALSVSGLPSDNFLFLGFLPHKKGRETLFKEIAASKRIVVFYESPHRIIKTLESLAKYIPERETVVARELTKIHEEVFSGTPNETLEYFLKNPVKQKGEFVVIISAK